MTAPINVDHSKLPLISLVVPAFNEQALIGEHLEEIVGYLTTLESEFRWEIVIVNDGSHDDTNVIINEFADRFPNVLALHHPRNFGLGQALRFGFSNTEGDYIIALDVDMSYDAPHIGQLARSIHGDGSQTRSFTYVSDTISGIYESIVRDEANGRIFNLGSNEEVTILELARRIHKASGTSGQPKIELIPYESFTGKKYEDVMRRVPDTSLAEKLLGFRASVSLGEGLKETIEWQRRQDFVG